jgi:hypothetical protein
MLAYTAALKFSDYRRAGASVSVYGIVPAPLVTPAGFALPWIEATAAVLLLTGRGFPVGPALTAGLAFAFAAGALYAVRSGADIDCGCAGERSEKVTRKTALRAIAMALAAILVLVVAPGPFGPAETTLFGLAGLVATAPGVVDLARRLVRRHQERDYPEHLKREVEQTIQLLATPAPPPHNA